MGSSTLQETRTGQATGAEAARTILLENDEVLAVATSYAPGASVAFHTHRFPSVVCVFEGGTLETVDLDGAVERYDLRTGETLWSASANAHAARNVGPTPIRIVEIEVKHAAPAAHGWHLAQRVLAAADLEWRPDTADPRRTAALLVGDPLRPGPYTVRFRAPAGYEIDLHMHPQDDEQLTVLSGTVLWSAGAAGSDAPVHTLGPGGFALAPAGTPHRIKAVENSVLQMSGVGPRTYVYLDNAKNPRPGRYVSLQAD